MGRRKRILLKPIAMKTIQQIQAFCLKEINEIEQDSRFQDAPADIQTNAVLALVQAVLKTRHRTLQEVLEIIKTTTDENNT